MENRTSMKRIQTIIFLLAFVATAFGQGNDGQFVIRRRTDNSNTGDHYLAHVKVGENWVLQDATTFSPSCLWYSGPNFNPVGTNHNYYFVDDENKFRFLAAPLSANGTLSLSASLPATSLLRNTDQIYYFYAWDPIVSGGSDARGVARGHQHTESTTEDDCGYSWEDGQCWEVYWVECDGTDWKLSSTYSYSITDNSARFHAVTVVEHAQVETPTSGGLTSITVPAEMEWEGTPESLSASVSDYTYDYIPAYGEYTFYGTTHYYYDGAEQSTAPSSQSGPTTTVSSYLWTLTGDGAQYLTLTGADTDTPTLTYSEQNTTGHKTATVTLTVTYENGITQSSSAEVTVKTPCQSPAQAASPVVTYESVTVSWLQTAESYKVYWKKSDETTWNAQAVGNVTSYEITGLDYGVGYNYKVSAICDGDEQPVSEANVYSFTTKTAPGSLVYGAVYGGGRMADVTGGTRVVIINTDSISAVYGGNDIFGEVGGTGSEIVLGVDASDDINSDSYLYNDGNASTKVRIGDVYGGGNGYYAYNGSSFVAATAREPEVTIEAGQSVTAPSSTGWDDVVWTNEETTAVSKTIPTIERTGIWVSNNAVQVDSIFGGAKNAFLTASSGNGSDITISGGTIYAVFGGNNYGGGQGYGKHHIEINGTKVETNVDNYNSGQLGRDFGIGYVFGGGNKVYGSTTEIFVNGGQCDNVFAGGNSADVYRANVTLNCSMASGSGTVFGNTYSNAVASYDGTTLTVKTTGYDWSGTGIYNVRNLYGGNNQAPMSAVPNVTLTSGSVGTVYGGGNAGDMLAQATDDGSGGTLSINGNSVKYSTHVEMDSPTLLVDYLYGGCQMSNVDYSTWVEIKNGHVGTVYGGCNVSGDVGSTRVNPDVTYSPEYAALYQAVQGGTYVVATGGTIHNNLIAGSNGYYHCNDGTVYVSGINYGDPEGNYIGMAIPTHNETTVMVHSGTTVKGNVYAGGNMSPVGFHEGASASFPQDVGLATVVMDGGTVQGNVFGGGNMADIYGSNVVEVSSGTIQGALYGGNDQLGQVARYSNRVGTATVASDNATSLQNVHAYVKITGNPTITEVYGGGNGDYDYSSGYCNSEDQPIQSNTFVDIAINGGAVPSGGTIGTVYGGGDGVTAEGFIKVFFNVQSATNNRNHVGTIFGGNNKGALSLANAVPDIILLHGQVGTVYGGCNEGAMTGDATVTVGTDTYNHIGSMVRLRNQYQATAGSTAVTPDVIINNAVYGGCRMNGVTHNTLVLVERSADDNDFAIFGGSDISGDVEGIAHVVLNQDAQVHDVYGGGNGNYYYDSNNVYDATDHSILIASGTVANPITAPYCDSTQVDMLAGTENPHTLTATNLYGGGYAGLCGYTMVNLNDGAVSNVFGGGNQAGTTNSGTATGNTTVNINSGTVAVGIYGGCNASGDIAGDITVNINGGTLGTDETDLTSGIFGGGYGASTSTTGNVTVNIGDDTHNPTIYGDIYGGSALGNVNSDASDATTVNVLNGTLNGDVYGGGLGDATHAAAVNGKVYVNIGKVDAGTYSGNATFNGRVFGCNNTNGSPQDSVFVNIYATAHDENNGYPDPVPANASELVGATASAFAIQAVYGGGNLADYAPDNSERTTTVHVYQCDKNTIKDVYGGSNRASAQNTHVIIDGGRIDRTFGGGNGEVGAADVVGTAKTDINAGLITQVFGGSNTNGNVGTIDLTITPSSTCTELINEVFAGSNQATVYGDVVTNLVGDCDGTVPTTSYYGGTNLADIYGDVTLNVYGGNYTNVFGGSKGLVDPSNSSNNVSADIKRFPTLAEVNDSPDSYSDELKSFLASNTSYYGKGGNVTLNLYGGTIENAFGGSDVLGDIEGKITVNVIEDGGSLTACPLNLTNVYGGGNQTAYNPQTTIVGVARLVPEVNILHGKVKEDVYGGGLGSGATVTANPVVTIGDDPTTGNASYRAIVGNGTFNGSGELTAEASTKGRVYGGGEEASVVGNTTVNIQKGNTLVIGTVFGGGKGVVSDTAAAIVKGNAYVNMTGGQVLHSIYGGGEISSVGDFTEYYAADDPLVTAGLHVKYEPKTCRPGTGLTEVRISGGMVGRLQQWMPDPHKPTADDDYGYVFTACMGEGDSITYPKANQLAVSDSAHLVISDSALITASVYGGSENGQVLRHTFVEIKGGQIGNGHYMTVIGNDTTHYWDERYTDAQWEAAIRAVRNGNFTNDSVGVFHVVNGWDFHQNESERYTYDVYAQYYNPADSVYYYDEEFTNPSHGGSYESGDGQSYFGHVFGGGSGYYPIAAGVWRRSAGRVCGNAKVEITGGHILNCVYGGNETTDVLGKSEVVMTGGTVGVPRARDSIMALPTRCNLYGGCKGDPRIMFNQWSNVGESVVSIGGDAVVFGSVFAGGEDGHVGDYLIPSPTGATGNATTTISGNATIGTFGSSGVDGNVFGGGRGYSALALTAGVVTGNINLTIEGSPKIWGSVYGGGRLAAVGTFLVPSDDEDHYGIMQDDSEEQHDHGHITINITGGTIGRSDQLRYDGETIHVGDVYGGSKGTLQKDNVFNQRLGLSKNATINISQPSGSTTRILGSVYGGGEIASVGSYVYASAADTTNYNPLHPTEPLSVEDVFEERYTNTGVATINITGGEIGQSTDTLRGHVFGGCLGRAGSVYSGYSYVINSHVTLNGGTVYGSIFGGGENGHVLEDTDVRIKSGSVGTRLDTVTQMNTRLIYRGNVYGGGRGIDQYRDPSNNNHYSITAGKVSRHTNVTITGGTIYRNVYGGGSLASVGDPDEEPDAETGLYSTGLATVTIKGGQIGTDGGYHNGVFNHQLENGHVFGSGRGVAGGSDSDYIDLAYVKNTEVTIDSAAYVTGSVFGSGENGHVRHDTKVVIRRDEGYTQTWHNDTTNVYEYYPIIGYPLGPSEMVEDVDNPKMVYRGNVYGGGRGIDHTNTDELSYTAGVTLGNTEVEITGGTVHHNVYGGGSLALVGTIEWNQANDSILDITKGTGIANVTVRGSAVIGTKGTVTTVTKEGEKTVQTLGGFNNGQVYGSGRGVASVGQTQYIEMAFVDSTHVVIGGTAKTDNPEILGSVFGGGANGHVKENTFIEMFSGTVGNALANGETPQASEVYRGNVYGGGRGIDHVSGSIPLSTTAGVVYGNSRVDIHGGLVRRNVYGGGSIATVGTKKQKPDTAQGEHYDPYGNVVDADGNILFNLNTGTATVNIDGGQIGIDGGYNNGADYNHLLENGHVFGSGRGIAGAQASEYIDLSYTVYTDVIIGGTAYVTGSVFGSGENGHVRKNTKVTINPGTGTRTNTVTREEENNPVIGYPLYATDMVEDPTTPLLVYRGNVYGGGRGIDHVDANTLSETAGIVFGYTEVEVNGGTVRHNVYGGGSMASVGGTYSSLSIKGETPERNSDEKLPGDTYVTIKGDAVIGVKGQVDGVTRGGFNNGQVYGSGRGLAGTGQYTHLAYVKNTFVTIGGSGEGDHPEVLGSVFGGGSNGHVQEDTHIEMYSGTVGTALANNESPISSEIYRGNVYGGGRGIDNIEPGLLSETAGRVYGNTNLHIYGGFVRRNVYGGGSLALVGDPDEEPDPQTGQYSTGLATVSITGGQIGTDGGYNNGTFNHLLENGHVFGSGRGVAGADNSIYIELAYVKNTDVTIGGTAYVTGSVFGSGENGHVRKDTHVTINADEDETYCHELQPQAEDIEPYPVIGYPLTQAEMVENTANPVLIYRGNVYGGGRGIDHVSGNALSATAGIVGGNTNVTVNGGTIRHNVYGGGSLARVGDPDEEPVNGTYSTGHANVTVNGGHIGMSPLLTVCQNGSDNYSGLNNGQVYGSGRGEAGADFAELAYVKFTHVEINGDTTSTKVYGSVFGGGANGHVRKDAEVVVNGGAIGFNDVATDLEIYRGNVYGGGRGIDLDATNHTISKTAGVVLGNASITIGSGGEAAEDLLIYHNIYGGGSMASVGTISYDESGDVTNVAEGTGTTNITINGGQIGINGTNNGRVFGAGRGRPGEETIGSVTIDYSELTYVNNTNVTFNGGTIKGCIFGAGDNGHTWGDTHVTMNGGTLGYTENTDPTTHENDGNIFGGGRGSDMYNDNTTISPTAGHVRGNTNITVIGGTLLHNIYGGGHLASVGNYTSNGDAAPTWVSGGTATIVVSGGTIGIDGNNNGRIFGAGRGQAGSDGVNDYTHLTWVNDTYVTVSNNAEVKGCVFGSGDNGHTLNDTHVTVTGGTIGTNGSTIDGNIFGGGRGQDLSGATGELSLTAGKTFGNTNVNMTGGTIKGNLYGGGNMSTVAHSTNIIVGGTAQIGASTYADGGNVYGASRGQADKPNYAKVESTSVTIDGSGVNIQNNVYGGGEIGAVDVQLNATSKAGADVPEIASIVTIGAGTILGDVFGGGDQGTTNSRVIVNMNGGIVEGELFGGAKGSTGQVFVSGLKTVNMRGGSVYSNVYGGSRNANDGNAFDATSSDTDYTAFVNISGGTVRQNVYGAGFMGHTFGSTDINVGKDAIMNANGANTDRGTHDIVDATSLYILKDIFAGSNWGDYDPATGFSASTISGYSNIYIDGNGYNTTDLTPLTAKFMNIEGSLFGSGTSCDGGTLGRKIQVANYGQAETGPQNLDPFTSKETVTVLQSATRSFNSIQRCDTLIFDNASVRLVGQGDLSQGHSTMTYSIYNIPKREGKATGVFVRNGSNIVADKMIDGIHAVYSQYRPGDDLYANAPTVYWVGIGDAGTATDGNFYYNGNNVLPSGNINTFRFNGGYSIYVRYDKQYGVPSGGTLAQTTDLDDEKTYFGELQGFFRIVTEAGNETFAHARPKVIGKGENTADGGFMSYLAAHNNFTDSGADYTKGKQFPYENVLSSRGRGDRTDFRYWRMRTDPNSNEVLTPITLYLESKPEHTDDFVSELVTIDLPPMQLCSGTDWSGVYFELFDIDFGDNAHIVDAAILNPTDNEHYYLVWEESVHTNDTVAKGETGNDVLTTAKGRMQSHPNNYFGLIMQPAGCLTSNTANLPYNLSENAKASICHIDVPAQTGARYYYPSVGPNGALTQITFRITYYKELTQSASLSPLTLTLKSFSETCSSNPIDVLTIPINIVTQTVLGQNVDITTYAMFDDLGSGNANEVYTVKSTLPAFELAGLGGQNIPFYVYGQAYAHKQIGTAVPTFNDSSGPFAANDHNYGMTVKRSSNPDNLNGWRENVVNIADDDICQINTGMTTDDAVCLGTADGREPFSIDFSLHYNSFTSGGEEIYASGTIGTLTFKICYPITPKGFSEANLDGVPTAVEDSVTDWKCFTVDVDIYKRVRSTNYYIDGEHGENSNDGDYADKGLLNLQGVLDKGWLPGDVVYVVRPMSVSTLGVVWNGNQEGGNVVLSRYTEEALSSEYTYNPQINTGYNSDNAAYQGAIFAKVTGTGHVTFDHLIFDGVPTTDETHALAPLISVSDGGTVTLSNGTVLRNAGNKATTDNQPEAGAIYVGNGGNLILKDGVTIQGNSVAIEDGAGAIYVADNTANLTVGGSVNITGNTATWTEGGSTVTKDCNVKLVDLRSVIVIDKDDRLADDARIGVYKEKDLFYTSGDNKDLTPIATSTYENFIQAAYANGNFIDDTRRAYTYYYSGDTLYYGRTWAHFVTNNGTYNETTNPEGIESGSFEVDASGNVTVSSSRAFAWLISYLNGLNGEEKHLGANVTLASDVDLTGHYWKPIELESDSPEYYHGTFDGQGKTIDGILVKREGFRNLGIFAKIGQSADGTQKGVVKNIVLQSNCLIEPWNPASDTREQYVGGIVGSVAEGGTVTACEVLPTMTADDANQYTFLGGVAGCVENGGVVHSVIGMPTLTGYYMGGLVGKIESGGKLLNSYSNIASITMKSESHGGGGLVGYNSGTVANCYTRLQLATEPTGFGWFVGRNDGTGSVSYCYAPEGKTNFVYHGTAPTGHGNFGDVIDRKAFRYLYDDNKVTLYAGQTNPHYSANVKYNRGQIDTWPGMLGVLNHWVKENPESVSGLATWFRPTTPQLNSDLPVLGLPDFNSVAALNSDSLLLQYDDIDDLLDAFNDNGVGEAEPEATLLFYGSATDVEKVPADNVKVYINEKAVLLQKQSSSKDADDLTATVGITFDNSSKAAEDYFGNTLDYDWHLLSSPLSNAPLGITYLDDLDHSDYNYSGVSSVSGGYMPDNIQSVTEAKWDFYTYYEPEYHWINFKRNGKSHHHRDIDHSQINYKATPDATPLENETTLVPGKGYMMAINEDTYLSTTGTLNKGNVTIKLECEEPDEISYAKGSNLIGNPYQAYLDLDKFFEANSDFTAAHIYDADQNAYAPYTTSASKNPAIPSKYISPHQGFFVITDTDNKTVTFTQAMAGDTHELESYFRDDGRPAYPLVNLFAEDEEGNRDLTVVEFGRPEMGGAKKEKALRTSLAQVYAHMDGESYSILFTEEGTTRVPVWFHADEEGIYKLTWETHNGIFSSLRLIDNMTGVNYDMLANDSYTFESSPTDYRSRFYITFAYVGIDENDDPNEGNDSFAFITNGNELYVNGTGWLEIVDVTGRVLHAIRLADEQTRISLNCYPKGVYLLRLSHSQNVKLQKIVLR